MALNIKDDETDRVARELARETGETITVAARVAMQERLARLRAAKRPDPREDELMRIIERGRQRAILDSRSSEDILGYDSDGLPS